MHDLKKDYDCPDLMKHTIGHSLPTEFIKKLEDLLSEYTDHEQADGDRDTNEEPELVGG